MLRQVSSRNHRSKGFKLKNALQICLLVVVTIWLLFQVKHSYDKKTEFEDQNAHLSIKRDDGGDRHEDFKFSRKDLPRDVRIEDEVSEDDLERELLKHDESGESDAIDEQDQGKEEDDADGGRGAPESEDEPSVFEDAESSKDGAHAAREESFRGDDVASAVVVAGHGGGGPEERGDHSREAREKSFNGDNVSSAVAHEDHLESAESRVAGVGENLTFVDSTSNGGLKDREVTPNHDVSSNSTVDEPRVDPTTANVDGNQTETPSSSSNKTADRDVIESPMNATTVLNNQIELLTTNLTVPEQNEMTNSGSGSGSGSAHDRNDTVIRIPRDDKFNTSSTRSSASSEKGEGKVEFQDTTHNMAEEMREAPNAKIEERAKSGEEAVLE